MQQLKLYQATGARATRCPRDAGVAVPAGVPVKDELTCQPGSRGRAAPRRRQGGNPLSHQNL
jgi:hypothetical protein